MLGGPGCAPPGLVLPTWKSSRRISSRECAARGLETGLDTWLAWLTSQVTGLGAWIFPSLEALALTGGGEERGPSWPSPAPGPGTLPPGPLCAGCKVRLPLCGVLVACGPWGCQTAVGTLGSHPEPVYCLSVPVLPAQIGCMQLLKLVCPRAHAPQQQKPLQEACTLQPNSSPQLTATREKAHV